MNKQTAKANIKAIINQIEFDLLEKMKNYSWPDEMTEPGGMRIRQNIEAAKSHLKDAFRQIEHFES